MKLLVKMNEFLKKKHFSLSLVNFEIFIPYSNANKPVLSFFFIILILFYYFYTIDSHTYTNNLHITLKKYKQTYCMKSLIYTYVCYDLFFALIFYSTLFHSIHSFFFLYIQLQHK